MTTGSELNYSYFRHYVLGLANARSLRVLDYGCGAGDVVALLRGAGIDCVGCDVFYEGGAEDSNPATQAMIRAGDIQYIDESGPLPYPPESFDLILANMVFEHVRDLETVLGNLLRVLKPTGHVLAHFPTREVVREGHIGIPFTHWFEQRSPLRRPCTLAVRRLGVGYFKQPGEGAEAWTDRQLAWIDRYCHYRSLPEVRGAIRGRYTVSFNEMPYMLFRAGERTWLRRLLGLPGAGSLYCRLFRRVAFTAFVLRPAGAEAGARRSEW